MIRFPCAKVNLGLHVYNRRSDGFHEIETIIYPVPLCDVLEIVPGKAHDHLTISGIEPEGTSDQNLVTHAISGLRINHTIPPVSIHLHKAIPFGAGLGGGSSDASCALLLLNELFNLDISNLELKRIASKIGSDCPAFIEPVPSIATGRGEITESVNVSLEGYFIVIVKPPFEISTRKAYSLVKPVKRNNSISDIVEQDIPDWKAVLTNDFEPALFRTYPYLQELKQHLYSLGAFYSSLSGSGSAVFGIFQEEPDVDRERFPDCFWWTGRL